MSTVFSGKMPSLEPEGNTLRSGRVRAETAEKAINCDLPSDLTEWVTSRELVTLIARLARRENESTLSAVFAVGTAPLFPHWTMLGILTYGLAVGVYGADRIATLARQDAELSRLCQGQFPDGEAIQHFREGNKAIIKNCLARVLEAVLKRKAQLNEGDGSVVPGGEHDLVGKHSPISRWIVYEADERLRRAAQEDEASRRLA